MDTLKKTIWYDTNSEPPKNYIWVKADGKAYEYNAGTKQWEESKEFSNASLDMFNEMTEEEKAQVRKDLGLYYEETTVVEETVSYTDEEESVDLPGFYLISDDTPEKTDIVSMIVGEDEFTELILEDRGDDDGYTITSNTNVFGFVVILSEAAGNTPGVYVKASVKDTAELKYNTTVTTISKVPEKFLPEQSGGGGVLTVTDFPYVGMEYEDFVSAGFTGEALMAICQTKEIDSLALSNGTQGKIVSSSYGISESTAEIGYSFTFYKNGQLVDVDVTPESELLIISDVLPYSGETNIVNLLQEPVFGSEASPIDIYDYFNASDIEKLFAGEIQIVKCDSENASGEFEDYSAKTWLVVIQQNEGTQYLYLIGSYLKGYCFYYDGAEETYYAFSFNWRAGSIQLSELPYSSITTQEALDECGLTTDAIHSLASGNVALRYVERYTDSLRLCILGVYWGDEMNYKIAFQDFTTKYVVENSDGTITVTLTPLS